MKKIKIVLVFSLVAVLVFLSGCAMSNKPCEYCGDTPTKGYTTSDDKKFYVCRDCSSECMFCGDRATKHYTNLLGMEMFVCRDCYNEIVD
ncbi:MAG: hypothetical protein IKB50_01460 [Clostridia bacterium]|nr:hypothetical protein [Clostridia bacterium]